MTEKGTILAFCAHNDDHTIGAGGTLAKYAQEGYEVLTHIFSYGEFGLPHIKPEIGAKIRGKEALRAEKVLGGSVRFLGLKEGAFLTEVHSSGAYDYIKTVIKKKKPVKIFTHSDNDPHPHHQDVHKIIMRALDETKYKGEVYGLDVWNPIVVKRRQDPQLVVDITDTFAKKIAACKLHHSQWFVMVLLWWNVYLKSIVNGWDHHCRYAEVFYKLR